NGRHEQHDAAGACEAPEDCGYYFLYTYSSGHLFFFGLAPVCFYCVPPNGPADRQTGTTCAGWSRHDIFDAAASKPLYLVSNHCRSGSTSVSMSPAPAVISNSISSFFKVDRIA